MDEKSYRFLRVRCRLIDGCIVSSDGLFPLDAILAAAWMRLNHPESYYNDGGRSGELIEAPLPLARVNIAGEWLWAASVAQYRLYGEQIYYWHKRFDDYLAERYLDKLRKINTQSGQYKNYRMPINVLLVGELNWFCVGDPIQIKNLLSTISGIGKKRAYGFGSIVLNEQGKPNWIVEPWPEDWSIRGPGGRLMRIVPFSGKVTEGATFRVWGIRPPNWHPANQVLAEIPRVGDWDGCA